jgi:uncharacterized secreted repeat protein (TIGR03808 family)
MVLSRRALLKRAPVLIGAGVPLSLAGAPVNAKEFGLVPDSEDDQGTVFQSAINKAATQGKALVLPGGRFTTGTLNVPSGLSLSGVGRATRLIANGPGPILKAEGATSILLENFSAEGMPAPDADKRSGLIDFADCPGIQLTGLSLTGGASHGLYLQRCGGTVGACAISAVGLAGVFALDSGGLSLTNNSVFECANGGILVWRSASGPDGTQVIGNRISSIEFANGGNGQNGNGVNVFRADDVNVSNNLITDCAFSAVRLNATNNCIVSANVCRDLGEVAIFSEFEFSGSIIANNLIDTAATGISMTNFNRGGRLGTCSGNVVRNITATSATNPDASPKGIAVQADIAVSANVVENVPGIGIRAGWGPYLRDITLSGNVVRQTDIGIAISVVKDAGPVNLSGNLISGARVGAIAGMRWRELITTNLGPGDFAHVGLAGNLIR